MYTYAVGKEIDFEMIKNHKMVKKWCKKYHFRIRGSKLTDSFKNVLIITKRCRGKYINIIITYNPYWKPYSILREIYLGIKPYSNLPIQNI